MRQAVRVAGWAILALVVGALVLPLLLFQFPYLLGADEALPVLSGSMEPTFGPGDIVLVERVPDAAALAVGDVVTFRSAPGSSVLYTHRIVNVTKDERGVVYTTRGDANRANDPMGVLPSMVVGRVVGSVPEYGYLVVLAKSKLGKLLLVLVPAALLLANEVRVLVRELSRTSEAKKDA